MTREEFEAKKKEMTEVVQKHSLAMTKLFEEYRAAAARFAEANQELIKLHTEWAETRTRVAAMKVNTRVDLKK